MTTDMMIGKPPAETNFFKRHYIWSSVFAFLLVVVIVVHTYFAGWLLNYVNNVLANIDGYPGSAQDISIDLYRGAYQIHELKINKKDGKIPTPFIAIKNVDFSLQWRALLHGRIVSDLELIGPTLNFARNGAAKQNGENVDWTKPIKQLMPIDINRVRFKDGTITYKDFSASPKVDIYIHHMQGEVSNLRNVVYKTDTLPSRVVIQGDSIGGGTLDIKGRMNILKAVPDMDLLLKLENVNLVALNDYSNAYGKFDFKSGKFNCYSEFIIKDSNVSGYVKPVMRDISIIDLNKTKNPIKLAWESIVAGVVTLFTNHTHDQFATKIELKGSLSNVQTDSWSAIKGIFHNAFITALQRGFDVGSQTKVIEQTTPE